MNETNMTRKTDPKYDDDLVNKRYIDKRLREFNPSDTNKTCPYEIGDILTTINDTDPSLRWEGTTWTQVTDDVYLKVVTSNAGEVDGTSSEHKIPAKSMPSHTHTMYATGGSSSRFNVTKSWSSSMQETAGTGSVLGSAGGGEAYYPYYLGVYVWIRES